MGVADESLEVCAILGNAGGPQVAAEKPAFLFEIEPTPVASRELRERLADGEEVDPEVPAAVGDLIRSEGLYGS